MKELLEQKKNWEGQLAITDPSDPYCNLCRQNLANIALQIEAATPKKTSKKSSKKSK